MEINEEKSSPRRIMMPGKGNTKVWRYMNLAAFLSVLQGQTFFFARLHKLEDPYEGLMPEALKAYFRQSQLESADGGRHAIETLEVYTRLSCVNCWHVNESESAAMWKLYAPEAGVAVQSSVLGLVEGFSGQGLKMALVQYIDLESEERPNLMFPIYLKRKSFSHENELRLVFPDDHIDTHPDGVSVPANLSRLVKRVHVAPSVPSWVVPVIRGAVEKYGLSVEVIQSTLYSLK